MVPAIHRAKAAGDYGAACADGLQGVAGVGAVVLAADSLGGAAGVIDEVEEAADDAYHGAGVGEGLAGGLDGGGDQGLAGAFGEFLGQVEGLLAGAGGGAAGGHAGPEAVVAGGGLGPGAERDRDVHDVERRREREVQALEHLGVPAVTLVELVDAGFELLEVLVSP